MCVCIYVYGNGQDEVNSRILKWLQLFVGIADNFSH